MNKIFFLRVEDKHYFMYEYEDGMSFTLGATTGSNSTRNSFEKFCSRYLGLNIKATKPPYAVVFTDRDAYVTLTLFELPASEVPI
jgi:hypothetical protein